MHVAVVLISDGPCFANDALVVAGLTSEEGSRCLTHRPGASQEWLAGCGLR